MNDTSNDIDHVVIQMRRVGLQNPIPNMQCQPVSTKIPTSFSQAKTDKNQRETISLDQTVLLNVDNWKFVSFKPNMNVVRSKWVFKIKENEGGSLERCQATLVYLKL